MIWQILPRSNMSPLTAPIAPDQPATLTAQGVESASPGPDQLQYRRPVEPTLEVAHRTVSAGAELAAIPVTFDLPNRLRNIYDRLRGGMRTTILAPELQSEIGLDAQVMPARGMNVPYKINEPGPWYDTFLRTVG